MSTRASAVLNRLVLTHAQLCQQHDPIEVSLRNTSARVGPLWPAHQFTSPILIYCHTPRSRCLPASKLGKCCMIKTDQHICTHNSHGPTLCRDPPLLGLCDEGWEHHLDHELVHLSRVCALSTSACRRAAARRAGRRVQHAHNFVGVRLRHNSSPGAFIGRPASFSSTASVQPAARLAPLSSIECCGQTDSLANRCVVSPSLR
jgi:hypothetical protein